MATIKQNNIDFTNVQASNIYAAQLSYVSLPNVLDNNGNTVNTTGQLLADYRIAG